MTLTVGKSSHASAVTLLLTDPVLKAYETCLDTSTGIVTIGDGIRPWSELSVMHPLGMNTSNGRIPALCAPKLEDGVYLCNTSVTIPCTLGAAITDSTRTGYSIFVHDKDGNEIFTRLTVTEDDITHITLNKSDLESNLTDEVSYVSLHCKSFGWGDGGSGYSGASNSVLIICAPDTVSEFAFINTVSTTLRNGIEFSFSGIIGTTTDTLTTVVSVYDGTTLVGNAVGTMSGAVVDALPYGSYTYVVRVLCGDVVVSTKSGIISVPSMTIPVVQSFVSNTSTLSVMTEYPQSPYIDDTISTVTLLVTSNGELTKLSVPKSHTYSVEVVPGSTVTLAIEYTFNTYPGTYVTNSNDISAPSTKAVSQLTASSGTWTVPESWFEDGENTISAYIIAIGCGGDGNNSTSEYTFGTAGGGGACVWIDGVTLTKDVAYSYTVGNRDIISNGITTFSDLLTANPGATGVQGGSVVSRAEGGTYSINTSSSLYTTTTTYGGGNGGKGGGDGINAGGGGGAGGPNGAGGNGGTENVMFYMTSNGMGGAGGAPRSGGGGTGIQSGLSGLLPGSAGNSGTDGLVYIAGQQRPDGGEFGGGGAGANSLFSPGHGGKGTIFIRRSE